MTLLVENIKLSGAFKLELFGPDGKLKEIRHVKNTIVTVGKNFLAAWLAASSQSTPFMEYQGLGEGTTASQASDTDLETPLATRVQGALSTPGSVSIVQNQATFGAGVNTGALTEAAMFSAVAAGTMFARQTFPVVNKQTGDSIVITWQITLA